MPEQSMPSSHSGDARDPTGAAYGAGRRRTVYLDMTDLVVYLSCNTTVSGIQRVVANLITHGPEAARQRGANFVLVVPEYDRQRLFAVEPEPVLAMLAAIERCEGEDRSELDAAIDAVYQSRQRVFPAPGDVFTIAGAFWTYEDYDLLTDLRRAGVGVVTFIHDLIQISHPEFVFEDATRRFRRTLLDIFASSSGLLTNSHYVARDLAAFIAARTEMTIPVHPVPLATELIARKGDAAALSARVTRLFETPYVLSVSTIEVRKNHAYMIRVWKELIEAGIEDLPELVFVGKIGWDIDPLIDYLEETDYLSGKVHILSNVSDDELAELYRNAHFTMYMSFVEGFGLPVAESLAYGVPCLSSDRSSMPEVGGRFARYLDPEDVAGGVAMVRALVEDPDDLARWRADIAANFRMRSWRSFSHDYVERLLALPVPAWRTSNDIFHPGTIYGMGRWDVAWRNLDAATLTYLGNTRLKGWHQNEDWGCWTAATRATLNLATSLPEGTAITLYARVQSPPKQHAYLTLDAGERSAELGIVTPEPVWKTMACTVGADGILSLTLKARGARAVDPTRRLRHVGLSALAFCREDDAGQRLSLIETLVLDRRRMGPPPELERPIHRLNLGAAETRVDAEWYLERYPDVEILGMSAQEHYEWLGKRLGRKPNAAQDHAAHTPR